MPKLIADSDMIYLRSTPIPRALESLQQAFTGFYPRNARTADFPPVTILTRSPADEVLYPNDSMCRRFAQLSRAFGQRAADRWNDTDEMAYLNKVLSKWMPAGSPRVAVDGKPRLSGIMDTINATLAHGPETRLPKEFYDPKARDIIDKIGVEEWYAGYVESQEYRALGAGALMGDIVSRMIGSVERKGNDGLVEVGGQDGHIGTGRGGEKDIKFAMSGCHDTTLASVLNSLGAFGGEKWPPYTSHIAIELFRRRSVARPAGLVPTGGITEDNTTKVTALDTNQGWWSKLFGSKASPKPDSILRRQMDELTVAEKENLDGYYVRLRYNDKIMQVPGCRAPGKHLNEDESFCTLVSRAILFSWCNASGARKAG
jgi:acid phosphatase